MTGLDFIPYGPAAVLVQLDDTLRPHAATLVHHLARRVADAAPEELVEITPGFSSVLLRFQRRAANPARILELLGEIPAPESLPPAAGRQHTIPVRYDGPDLAELADRHGLSIAEVIQRHTASELHVRCLGFMPGFGYLSGLDPTLHTPRRDTPRTVVPAGSVAIGGEHAGIYPVPSPGGWNLIGSTSHRLFNPAATRLDEQFLLAPGDRVRFAASSDSGTPAFDPARWTTPSMAWLRVKSTGAILGVQDAGRPGLARFGVATGGALDPAALHWANRLLGNPDAAPVLEFAGGGQIFEALTHLTVAITGADAGAEVHAPDGTVRTLRPWGTINLAPREILQFRGPREGVWTYLAVRGGIAAPRPLGSASTNARAGIGCAPRAGDTLAGTAHDTLLGDATGSRRTDPTRIPGRNTNAIRVWPGPQSESFDETAHRGLFRNIWRISPKSDRVGYRLDGPPIPAPSRYLESEPVLPGSIQVPPDGLPIITLPDGPTVGGYPKIGWVDPRDLWRVAQTPAGRPLELIPTGWD
jgi:KipI family sensor histidine kinase inhibitor